LQAEAAAMRIFVRTFRHAGAALVLSATLAAAHEQAKPDAGQSPDAPPSAGDRIEEWAGAHRDWAERFMGLGDAGFFPLVGVVVPGSGLAAGAGYRQHRLAGGPLGFDISGLFSYRGYQAYRARFGMLRRERNSVSLRPGESNLASQFNEGRSRSRGVGAHFEVGYNDYPRHPFYGVGPASRAADRSDYRLSGAGYAVVVQAQVTRSLAISARGGLLAPDVSPGDDDGHPNVDERFTDTVAPGLGRQPDFTAVGMGAVLDLRDNPIRPQAGSLVGVTAWRFVSRGSGGFDFTRLLLDVRGYSTPLAPGHVLALRLLVSSARPDDGSRVPFYLQHTLGGNQTLRGFHGYRFRDNFLAAMSAEYRWNAHRFVDIVPFVDAGGVAPGMRAISWQNVEATVGVGAGLKWGGTVVVRMDVGRSRDGYHLAFGAGPLF
jgi:hypothetical protein